MTNSSSGDEQSKLHSALRNPTRRSIIELLGERRSMRFSELKESLNVPVGTLYYHFETLGELVTQDAEKQYSLTSKGLQVYESIRTITPGSPPALRIPRIGIIRSAISPWGRYDPFVWLLTSPVVGISLASTILLAGTALMGISLYWPLLFFIEYSSGPGSAKALSFLIGWLSLFISLELLGRLVFKKRGGVWRLAVVTAVGVFPLSVFPSLEAGLSLLGSGISSVILLGLLQISGFTALLVGLSSAKGFSRRQAALSATLLFYANAFIAFVLDLSNIAF